MKLVFSGQGTQKKKKKKGEKGVCERQISSLQAYTEPRLYGYTDIHYKSAIGG